MPRRRPDPTEPPIAIEDPPEPGGHFGIPMPPKSKKPAAKKPNKTPKKNKNKSLSSVPLNYAPQIPHARHTLSVHRDGITVSATEVFHEIDSTSEFVLRPFAVVPTNVLMFPTLQTLSLAFTKAKIRKVRVTYHATCSALQTGRIGMAYVNDPKRSAPSSFRDLLAYSRSNVGPVYRNQTVECDLDRDFEFYLQTFTGFSDSQLRFEIPGYVVVATDESATTEIGLPAGLLSVEYIVELYGLRPPTQVSANFKNATTQAITDGTIVAGNFIQNVKTPDSDIVVGYYGHSNDVKDPEGVLLWEKFESVAIAAGKWVFNGFLDFVAAGVVLADEKYPQRGKSLADDGLVWVEDPDDDSKSSSMRAYRVHNRDGSILVYPDRSLDAYIERRNAFVKVLENDRLSRSNTSFLALKASFDLIKKFREEFTPYDANWSASKTAIKNFMRKNFRMDREQMTSPAFSGLMRARTTCVLTIPPGVSTRPLDTLHLYDPEVEVNVTGTFICVEPDGTSMTVKADVISATVDARETYIFRVSTEPTTDGCRLGIQMSVDDAYTLALNGPSTEQVAANDSSTEVNGCAFSAQSLYLSSTAIDFQSA
jgi:hypothetical protein